MKRTEAREFAFMMIFQYKFRTSEISEIVDDFKEHYSCENQEEYINKAVYGTVEKIDELDALINEVSKEWSTTRMSSVRLAVLRLAVYEMIYMQDIPRVIVINEAVRISKIYDGDESAPFINGILDSINKKYPTVLENETE